MYNLIVRNLENYTSIYAIKRRIIQQVNRGTATSEKRLKTGNRNPKIKAAENKEP